MYMSIYKVISTTHTHTCRYMYVYSGVCLLYSTFCISQLVHELDLLLLHVFAINIQWILANLDL